MEHPDALLLAFAELAGYGIATVAGADGTADEARAEIAAAVRARAPYGLGSHVFWLAADERDFAGGGADAPGPRCRGLNGTG